MRKNSDFAIAKTRAKNNLFFRLIGDENKEMNALWGDHLQNISADFESNLRSEKTPQCAYGSSLDPIKKVLFALHQL